MAAFHMTDAPTKYYWMLGPQGEQVSELDIGLPQESGYPKSLQTSEGVYTFIQYKEATDYMTAAKALNPNLSKYGRRTLHPVRNPTDKSGRVLISNVDSLLFDALQMAVRQIVLEAVVRGEDPRPPALKRAKTERGESGAASFRRPRLTLPAETQDDYVE